MSNPEESPNPDEGNNKPDQAQEETTVDQPSKPEQKSNFTEQFEKMLEHYGEEYMKKVMEVAKKDQFTITLNVPTGKKIQSPIEPYEERDEYDGVEQKTYKRRPISATDYHKSEKLRAQFQNEKDPDKVADNQAKIYRFLAFCYLGMSPAEFERIADWTQFKLVIDGCNHKTMYQAAS